MTDTQKHLYERIYEYLKMQSGLTRVTHLADHIGTNERALRSDGANPGILDLASAYCLQTHGRVIIRSMNPPGVAITANVEEIRAVIRQWVAFRDSIDRQVKRYGADIAFLERDKYERRQLNLPLEPA